MANGKANCEMRDFSVSYCGNRSLFDMRECIFFGYPNTISYQSYLITETYVSAYLNPRPHPKTYESFNICWTSSNPV